MRIFGFEEFSLNESFQSGKLKDIIRQNGMPEYNSDKKLLHDLKDSEVIGVMDWDEWSEYYQNHKGECYCVRLENDKYLVLGNVDTLGYFLDDDKIEKEFDRRRNERHQGNELNGLNRMEKIDALKDASQKHFEEQKDKLTHKRNLDAFKTEIGDTGDKLYRTIIEGLNESFFEDWAKSGSVGDSGSNECIEFGITYNDRTYTIEYRFNYSKSGSHTSHGEKVYDLRINPVSYKIWTEDIEDVFELNEVLDDCKDLYDAYTVEDIGGEVVDPYEYYGVSRGDFY